MFSKPHLYGLIPRQPSIIMSYLVAGKLLYISAGLFMLESYIYWNFLQAALIKDVLIWSILWACLFLFSFAHIFLVIADGWSRFQDYKRAKDQLFMYGYQLKIINQFANSQCQRFAFTTAAKELGLGKEAKEHFYTLGYRWFHLIPDFMVKDPFFFYKRFFWKRTFLEKYYKPKFNYHQLAVEPLLK